MKSLKSGIWRPVRYLILLASAGAVLAADNTWMTSLRFADSKSWLSTFFPAETPRAEVAISYEQSNPNGVELSMSRLLNGLLFSRASSGWSLASAQREETSDWMAQQSGPSVSLSSGGLLAPALFSSGFIAAGPISGVENASLPSGPTAPTANGTWAANASGNWGNAANWSGGVVADGAGNMAHFDALDITTDVTVTLDTSRTIGELYIGDTNGTHRYSINPAGGTSLTFDSGVQFVNAVLQQSSTSAGDTIAAPLLLNSDLNINNLSSANPFQITGNIASSGGPSSFQNLWFNNATGAAGEIRVTGNISNGTGEIGVVVVDGTVIFSGTNTYGGSTSVDGGLLLINGNNSGATGTIFVGAGGTLGGTGTVGGSVQTFDGTITGATPSTVGTLTLLGNVDLSTGEGDGTYLANLSGSLSDLLAISGTLSLGAGSILDIDGVGDGVTTYTLATFASRDDVFGTVMDIPGGYSLVYHDMDIQLVPIPEPATWIGGGLALGALVFARRKRKAEKRKS